MLYSCLWQVTYLALIFLLHGFKSLFWSPNHHLHLRGILDIFGVGIVKGPEILYREFLVII